MSHHRVVQGEHIPKPAGPYSPAIGFERLVFVAGQGATDPATGRMPDDIEGQTEQCIRNVETILKAAGSSCMVVQSSLVPVDLTNAAQEAVSFLMTTANCSGVLQALMPANRFE